MKKIIVLSSFFVFLFFSIAFYHRVLSENETVKENPGVKTIREPKFCVVGKKVTTFPFYVYKDGNSNENNFFASGYMGDINDLRIDLYSQDNPYEGSTCVKVVYKKTSENIGWAGLYWQYPANNWADTALAYDLRLAKRLTFFARGQNGGEVINIFQVGGIAGKYSDTAIKAIGPVTLSKDWARYTIDLTGLNYSIIFGREFKECWPFMDPLSRVIGGFSFALSMDANKSQDVTFYLDDIKFEDK